MSRLHRVFVLLALLLAAAGYWLMRPSEGIRFIDVASQAGLSIEFDNRAEGQYRVIETMGTGVALIDYDSDGWLDVVVGQGGELPGDAVPSPLSCVLYRNNRDGTFSDVTQASGLRFTAFAQGMAVGDFDGDGHSDLFIAGFGRSALFRNTGRGGFEDVTEAAGVAGSGWASSCAFADLNGNGYLDLYVVRYLANTIDEFGLRPIQTEDLSGYRHGHLQRQAGRRSDGWLLVHRSQHPGSHRRDRQSGQV